MITIVTQVSNTIRSLCPLESDGLPLQYLIIGYELQTQALGIAAATASGQDYYPYVTKLPHGRIIARGSQGNDTG